MIMIFGPPVLNDDISRCFFFFLIFLFFGLLGERGGDKRAKKMAQDDKKFHLLHFISQEPCMIWLSFMVHLCKIMISPGVFFFFFKILILWVVIGFEVKGQKIVQNEKKFCQLRSISEESYIIWFSFTVLRLWYSFVKW